MCADMHLQQTKAIKYEINKQALCLAGVHLQQTKATKCGATRRHHPEKLILAS